MILHDKQRAIVRSLARFKVIRAGRRSGKTEVKKEIMSFKAISRTIKLARVLRNRSLIFIAPTQKQARTIIWNAFKDRLGDNAIYNEARLEIQVRTEDGGLSTIFVGGWENRENYRGMPNVVHIEFDEVDTMKNFFIGWNEIFRPMLIDTGGSAGFGGTPKKENPNLRRLEKEAEGNLEWECFHFTTYDNPHVPREEIEKARAELDPQIFRQEILAEHVDNEGALFKFTAIVDVFSNTVEKKGQKYLIIDVADDGSDKTKFSYWEDMEEYKRETYTHMNTEGIIAKAREAAAQERIPFSHILVDAIGVGAAVASSSQLEGIIGFKSSYSPIKTDMDIVRLPNVGYTNSAPLTSDFKNLRSQCVFTLAEQVNNHKIASRVTQKDKETIIEELAVYQDVSKGDGKRMATPKEEVKEIIGRSPDDSDTWIMRMYFVLRERMLPDEGPEREIIHQHQQNNFLRNRKNQAMNSSK